MLRIAVVEDDPADQAHLQEMIRRFAKASGEESTVTVFGGGMEFL